MCAHICMHTQNAGVKACGHFLAECKTENLIKEQEQWAKLGWGGGDNKYL